MLSTVGEEEKGADDHEDTNDHANSLRELIDEPGPTPAQSGAFTIGESL